MNLLWLLAGLLVIVVAGIVWAVARGRPEKGAQSTNTIHDQHRMPASPAARAPTQTWGKTVVVPDPAEACPAVLRILGKTYPNAEAPRLPLANCSVAHCKCRYEPTKERRKGPERRSGEDRRTQLRFEPGKPGDRRNGKDRRHRKGYDWDHTI